MSFKSALLSLSALISLTTATNYDVRIQGLAYIPNTITAKAGDTVTFHFINSAHDVAQGSFTSPCNPSDGGFYSGLDVSGKKFIIDIKNDDPIYFYCTVPGHCRGGMVGGINTPDSGNSVSAYSSAAKQASSSSAPDDVAGGQLIEEAATLTTTSTSSRDLFLTATTQGLTSSISSAVSSAQTSVSSRVSSVSSAASSVTSAAGGAVSSAVSSVTSAVAGATSSPASAANALLVGSGEYGSGKVVLSALAAIGAGLVFWAGLL